jgi:hypothetical protein
MPYYNWTILLLIHHRFLEFVILALCNVVMPSLNALSFDLCGSLNFSFGLGDGRGKSDGCEQDSQAAEVGCELHIEGVGGSLLGKGP